MGNRLKWTVQKWDVKLNGLRSSPDVVALRPRLRIISMAQNSRFASRSYYGGNIEPGPKFIGPDVFYRLMSRLEINFPHRNGNFGIFIKPGSHFSGLNYEGVSSKK